jgi:hypothetical protein
MMRTFNNDIIINHNIYISFHFKNLLILLLILLIISIECKYVVNKSLYQKYFQKMLHTDNVDSS